ncbi:NifU family protein [Actinoplanes sp. KI2]|nr:NifU family protein [Actinoplanes sp. KI2]MCU7729084.1 NifU family protein [Actinoplanes sp. KI2]
MTVALHPQACPGEPDRLRWIVPAGTLTVTGVAVAVPDPLAALLADGTLAEIAVEPSAVLTRLGPGRGWAVDGPRVRTALHAALERSDAWAVAPTLDRGFDALLAAEVRKLLDGAAGEFARSHGGGIELLDVHDGVVTVRLAGACHGCPAARITLHQRLERELRRRCPAVRAVVAGPHRDRSEGAGWRAASRTATGAGGGVGAGARRAR